MGGKNAGRSEAFQRAKNAQTFAELFNRYELLWGPTGVNCPDSVMKEAHKAVRDSGVDVWEHLEKVLRHTIKHYNPRRSPFLRLFARNFREQMRKASARAAQRERREQKE